MVVEDDELVDEGCAPWPVLVPASCVGGDEGIGNSDTSTFFELSDEDVVFHDREIRVSLGLVE